MDVSPDTFNIIDDATTPVGVPIFDHGFYTGDAVYYTPQIVNDVYVDPTSGTELDNFVIKSHICLKIPKCKYHKSLSTELGFNFSLFM